MGEAGYQLSMESLLIAVLLKAARIKNVAKPTVKRSILLQHFRDLVELHFRKEHVVEYYASALGISSKALTIKVSRLLGKPPSVIIQERCIVEAKRLLAYSELSIAEIGYAIGYDDPNYFARLFRQKAGLTPGAFRKSARRSVPA